MMDNQAAGIVIEFMALFAKLKDWSDDKPEDVVDLAGSDLGILELCKKVNSVFYMLRDFETAEPQSYSRRTNPAFLKSYRDFELRYALPLYEVHIRNNDGEDSWVPNSALTVEMRWSRANVVGHIHELLLQRLFIASEILGVSLKDKLDEIMPLDKHEGITATVAWKVLTENVGLEPISAIRRRELLPFIYVPNNVANKESLGKTIGLFKNLEDAQRAFVFGALRASVSMMRSVLEAVLRDHYRADGKKLFELIRSANERGQLREGADKTALYRIKDLSDAILHVGTEKDESRTLFEYNRLKRVLEMDEQQLEQEIVSLFLVLRLLIERAPG